MFYENVEIQNKLKNYKFYHTVVQRWRHTQMQYSSVFFYFALNGIALNFVVL